MRLSYPLDEFAEDDNGRLHYGNREFIVEVPDDKEKDVLRALDEMRAAWHSTDTEKCLEEYLLHG